MDLTSLQEVRRAIAKAERVLPGTPMKDPKKADPRWQAIIKIGHWIEEEPEEIWPFALKWGKHPQEDLRDAVATVLLEHLLEHHFNLLFPRLKEAVMKSPRFKDTLGRCWWMGEAARVKNSRLLDRLAGKKIWRTRIPKKETR